MRAAVATVLAVLVGLLLPVAVTAAWTRADVTDRDGYVAATAPLAQDPEVRQALADLLFTAARQAVDLAVVPGAEPVADLVVEQAVAGALRGPTFARVWTAGNRRAHPALLAILRGDDDGPTIDLSPVLNDVLDELATYDLDAPSVAYASVIGISLADSTSLGVAQRVYPPLDALGRGGLVACAVLAAAAIALAPRRRRTTRVLAAVAALTTGAALVALLLAGAQDGALGAVDSIVSRDLRRGLLAALAVVAALGLGTVLPGRQANRS